MDTVLPPDGQYAGESLLFAIYNVNAPQVSDSPRGRTSNLPVLSRQTSPRESPRIPRHASEPRRISDGVVRVMGCSRAVGVV